MAERNRNVYAFVFKSKEYGKTVYAIQISHMLTLDKNKMVEIYKKHQGTVVSAFGFYFNMSGVVSSWKLAIHIYNRQIRKADGKM